MGQPCRKVCELVNLAAVARPPTNTELEEVLEAAHVYDTSRFATLVKQYEMSGLALPENHAQISVVGLAQHLEATQIRHHFRRKTGLDAGKLKEAGQLRTAWRSLRELEEKNFDQLVKSAFDMADKDGDKRISLAERKWLLAAVSNDLGDGGGPSWWPRDGQWPGWWPESWSEDVFVEQKEFISIHRQAAERISAKEYVHELLPAAQNAVESGKQTLKQDVLARVISAMDKHSETDGLTVEEILALLDANDDRLASGWALDLLMDDEKTPLDEAGYRAGRHTSECTRRVAGGHMLGRSNKTN